MHIVRVMPLLLSLLVVGAACSGTGTAERILESQEGIDGVDIDEGGGVVSIEADDGETSLVIGGGEVPDDFPIPVAPGGTVLTVVEQDAAVAVSIQYGGDDYQRLAGFYKDFAAREDIEVSDTSANDEPPFTSWNLAAGQSRYTIVVIHSGDVTQVQLTAGLAE